MKIKERLIQNFMIVKWLKMIMTKDSLKMEEKNSKNIHHVPKCMSCHKAIVVINGKAHCFHDNIYIMILCSSCFCEIWALCVPWITYDHLYIIWYMYNIYMIYIHTYICIYIYIYIHIHIYIYIYIYILNKTCVAFAFLRIYIFLMF